MLDVSHAMTQHLFKASRLLDGVMTRGQTISVSPSVVRVALLAECLPLLAEMRELGRGQLGKQTAMGWEQITEVRWDSDIGSCPCGDPLLTTASRGRSGLHRTARRSRNRGCTPSRRPRASR
jgi:hypothetical protein